MTTPMVSVVIDTYNYGRFVEQAIDSALGQELPKGEMEILVVDDGSTDDTADRVKKYGDAVRYFWKLNGGQASAINFGTARAKGQLIAFLDGDDVWLPTKLSRVVKEFEKNPSAGMVYHRYCFWDSRENCNWDPDYFSEVSGDVLADRRKLATYIAAPTSSLTFRREILERLLPIPEPCSFMHDLYLVSTAICLGPVAFAGECLTRNRVHGQNLWFAERGQPDRNILKRRMQARLAATEATRNWIQRNASAGSQNKARLLLRRLELLQDRDEFRLEPPNRFRYFIYLCLDTWTHASTVSRPYLAYKWFQAFAALILGYKHSDKLEGVLTRVKGFKHRIRLRSHTQDKEA